MSRLLARTALGLMIGCNATEQPAKPADVATPEPRNASPACPSPPDSLRPGASIPPDCGSPTPACRRACEEGDASSCFALAYALEVEPGAAAEARATFHRACTLGSAIACTNVAAKLWMDDVELSCATHLFERSCTAGDAYACGMAGRVLLEVDPPPDDAVKAKARADLERSCAALRGFPCRVLAKHLEQGTIGTADRAEIVKLLASACAGGDPPACGEPPSAAGTFERGPAGR